MRFLHFLLQKTAFLNIYFVYLVLIPAWYNFKIVQFIGTKKSHTIQYIVAFWIFLQGLYYYWSVKFINSEKDTFFCEISTVDFVVCSKGQIYGGDFAKFCGLPRIYEF